MEIKETSSIKLEVDGRIIDETFHDSNDAWEKAMNQIMRGKTRATITEIVTIKKV
jgi:hypothetical protein